MPGAKETQAKAIHDFENKMSLFELPLETGLAQLEQAIIGQHTHPHAEFPINHATTIIKAIMSDKEFMIALIFNSDHTKVVALPLPEVFDQNGDRLKVGKNTLATYHGVYEVVEGTFTTLHYHEANRDANLLHDVVLIQKNMGENRRFGQLSLGAWDVAVAESQKDSRYYNSWIFDVMADLNRR